MGVLVRLRHRNRAGPELRAEYKQGGLFLGMRRARFIPLFLSVVVAPRLAAQWQLTADVGMSRLEQAEIPRSNAQTFGLSVDGSIPRAWVRSSVLASHSGIDRWTAQSGLTASLLGPLDHRVRWELSSALSAFAEANANTAWSAEGIGRLVAGSARRGGALGFGGGLRRADADPQPVGRVSLGGWIGMNREQLSAEASFVQTTTQPQNTANRLALSYADLSTSWRHGQGTFSAGATIGVRVSNSGFWVPDGGWGMINAGAWLLPSMAVVASAGRSPQDVVRGVPRITYASVALRFTSLPRPSSSRPRVRGAELTATREGLEVRGTAAARVELIADFTNWKPVELERAGDVWRLQHALSSGLHRLMMRIDGGEWTTPANLPTTTDALGGVVALVTVP